MKEHTIQCEKCGHINEWGENFCANCGVPLQYTQTTPKPNSSPEKLVKQTRSSRPAPPEKLGSNLSRAAQTPQPSRARPSAPEHLTDPVGKVSAKKRGPSRIAWIIGISISACVGLGVLAIVVITGFLSQSKTLGNMTITSGGGSFQQQAVTITASPGAASFPLTLAITQLSDNLKPEEGVLAQAAPLQITGALDQLHGSLLVTLPIPSGWLAADGTLPAGQTVEIVEQGQAYGTSVGVITDRHPVPTRIDLQARTATAEVVFASSATASRSTPHLASPMRRDDYALTYRMLKIREEQFKCYNYDFRIWPGFVPLSTENCQTLLDSLGSSKKKLEDMGFTDVFNQHERPIQVYLESLNSNDKYAYATVGPFSSVKHSYIVLNKNDLETGQCMDPSNPGNIPFIKSTIGHEMFHMVQFAYNPILKAALSPGLLKEPEHLRTLWSDEAMSVWFEPYAADTPASVPAIANSNMGFINHPLFAPEDLETDREKGYGASFFLRYLTNKYGQGLVKEILEYQDQQDVNTGVALLAWSHAVASHGGSIEDDWQEFLETYLLNPKALGFDLINTSSETRDNELALESDINTSNAESQGANYDKWYATFTDIHNATKFMSGAKRGYVTRPNDPAYVQLQVPLKDFSSIPIRLSIKDTGQFVSKVPGKLVIKVMCQAGSQSIQACPEGIGLLIYPTPGGAEYATTANALSSVSDHIWPGDVNQVTWSSQEFASNQSSTYSVLVLIPFNDYAASYTDSTNVLIDFYYYWDFEEYYIQEFGVPPPSDDSGAAVPTDTPTPEPSTSVQNLGEMSPQEICACEARWMSEVMLPADQEFWKNELGSNFLSETLKEYRPYTYNPSTNLCEGDYATRLCLVTPDDPNSCHNNWGDLDGNGLTPMSVGLDDVRKHIEDAPPGFSCK